MRGKSHPSVEALIQDLDESVMFQATRNKKKPQPQSRGHKPPPKDEHKDTPKDERKDDRKEHRKPFKRPSPPEFKCFNCKKVGHVAKDCPEKRKECSKCKFLGHLAVDCTKTQTCFVIGDGSVSKDRKEILIEGEAVRGCIDTGGDVTLVKISAASQLRVVEKSPGVVDGVGGSSDTLGKLTAEIEIDGVKWKPLDITVVPDGSLWS